MDETRIAALPGNTNKSREGPQSMPIERERIVTGNVIRKRKGFFKNIKEIGLNNMLRDVLETAANILEFVWIIGDGVDMLRGERPRGSFNRRSYNNQPPQRGSYVSYDRVQEQQRKDTRREMSRTGRMARLDFDEFSFDTQNEAELVLFSLIDEIQRYGYTNVAAFYQYWGAPTSAVDFDWGWTNLSNVRAMRVPGDRWILNLPRPIPLDK